MIKNSVLITLTLIILSSCSARKNKNSVSISLYYTEQYCGGAAPDDEILEQYKTVKPFADTLYLHDNPDRNDEGNILVFNKQGKAKLTAVGEGTYFAFRYPKIDPLSIKIDPSRPSDPLCEFNFQNREMIPFNVDINTKSITDTINFSCNPCDLEMPMMPPPPMEEE